MKAFDRAVGVAPAERLAVVRIGVFGFGSLYLLVRFSSILSVRDLADRRFDPVGPIGLLDGPVSDLALVAALIATIVACGAAAAGWRWRESSIVAALGLIAVLSYRLSWGQILHTENLLVLHAAILVFTPAADAWTVGNRRAKPAPQPSWRYGWALQTLALATILGYLIAAWAKIRNGGLDWMTGDVLRSHIAADNLLKELLGDPTSPLTSLVVPQGWLFPPMAVGAILAEVGAFLAMSRGSFRKLWVATMWLFHVAVLALMAILFPYQLLGIAFLPFLKGEKLIAHLARRWRRDGALPVENDRISVAPDAKAGG